MIRPTSMFAACRSVLAVTAVATVAALALSTPAGADPEECDQTIYVYDPHYLVWDTEVLVDVGTVMDVESLVHDYTERIDVALDAEAEGPEPPDGASSDELIDDARWEIEDAADLGRSTAGCEE
jgi:hypothetical protein